MRDPQMVEPKMVEMNSRDSYYQTPFSVIFPLFGSRVRHCQLGQIAAIEDLHSQSRGGIIIFDWITSNASSNRHDNNNTDVIPNSAAEEESDFNNRISQRVAPELGMSSEESKTEFDIIFCLGKDSLYGNLTDFGGKISLRRRSLISECFREFKEETLWSFPVDMISALFNHLPVIYDDDNVIIFLPLCLIKSTLNYELYRYNCKLPVTQIYPYPHCYLSYEEMYSINQRQQEHNKLEADYLSKRKQIYQKSSFKYHSMKVSDRSQIEIRPSVELLDGRNSVSLEIGGEEDNSVGGVEISSIHWIPQAQLADMIETPNLHPQLYYRTREFLYRAGNFYSLIYQFIQVASSETIALPRKESTKEAGQKISSNVKSI